MGAKVLQMVAGDKRDMTVQFWGMAGEFSFLVLQRLLDAGIAVKAVVIPAAAAVMQQQPVVRLQAEPPVSSLPIGQPYLQHTLVHLGWQNQIPVYEIRQLQSPMVAQYLAAGEADVAIVACFPWRIPESLLAVPRHGFLNLHPSLLPELRGPYPLFWAFRLGLPQTGVTVHQMDPRFDTGPIALQKALVLPDGINGRDADRLLADAGSSLLVQAVGQLASGSLQLIPQTPGGSRYSRPAKADFTIPTTWSARRAFNFIRGTAVWNTPYHIKGPEISLSVREAVAFQADARQESGLTQDGPDRWIQFTPGVLHAR